MTNVTEVSSARTNRSELERTLLSALAHGTRAIDQQIRITLMLSRLVQPSTPHITPETPLSIEQARLITLANLAESLGDSQIEAIMRETRHVTDSATRLAIVTRLALRLPPQYYQATIVNLFHQAAKLNDPAASAHLLFQIAPLLMLLHDEPSAPPALLDMVALAQSISSPEARIRSLVTLSPYLPQSMRLRVLHRALDEVDKLNSDIYRCNAIHTLSEHLIPEIHERVLRSAEAIKSPAERARAFTALARYLPIQSELHENALEAIGTLIDEEERADALIAFAPHLEYSTDPEHFPALLEHALGIAISMTRRAMRARVLVALAPHLMHDLQGEALAAVHSLTNERERAMLLAELAPTLPPDMLVASLAVAHSMQMQDARVHALSVMAHHAPEHARDRTILDALAAASNLPHHLERVTALIALLDILPEQLKDQTLEHALESTRQIANENARARAIGLLVPHLSESLFGQALEIAHSLLNDEQRFSALLNLVSRLSDGREVVLQELLDITRSITVEYKLARTLVDLIPGLTDELLPQALNLAHSIEDPFDRLSVYLALVKKLSAEQQRSLIGECWKLIRVIDNGYDAASALSTIAPMLPASAAADLAQTAGMIIGSIMDDYDQASAIGMSVPLLANPAASTAPQPPDRDAALAIGLRAALNVQHQAQRSQLLAEAAALWADTVDSERSYQLWRETLLKLSSLPLADALLCLTALLPVIRKLGGEAAILTIARMIEIR